ncbi:MAG: hypothetical protein ACO29Q_10390 [Crocinitomicaceae bacterium]
MEKNFTYQQLLYYLKNMSKSDLNKNVTVYDSNSDEFMPVSSISFTTESDVLDADHPLLKI